ncbi:hypothetical protein P280DRAFT_466303 [Massarina eburnea CBS 473.64]|uniref:Uncharacterized protein n=1 Tax=Massarina eburnea CBS 473.64 TaxID=1395130 RepID=A0A6A6SCQ4_9PLEO|nr:hypothetical protein P280DRAFT_466303 [Massarina eburnea CBS 473.64]
MLLSSFYLSLVLSALTTALPFDGPLNARAKSYAIVNVDGGSTASPASSTVVDDKTKTKTVEVTESAATKTDTRTGQVTATVAPTASSTPTASPRTTAQPTITPSPSVVTVIVTESAASSSYYDNGLWHTSYAIKTWAAMTTVSSDASLPTALSAAEYED